MSTQQTILARRLEKGKLTQQTILARRLEKGKLPKFAENLDVDSLSKSHCMKLIKDIKKYDEDNKQHFFGGKRRRRTKRRRTKRRRTKRRRTKRRRTKRRRRKR